MTKPIPPLCPIEAERAVRKTAGRLVADAMRALDLTLDEAEELQRFLDDMIDRRDWKTAEAMNR